MNGGLNYKLFIEVFQSALFQTGLALPDSDQHGPRELVDLDSMTRFYKLELRPPRPGRPPESPDSRINLQIQWDAIQTARTMISEDFLLSSVAGFGYARDGTLVEIVKGFPPARVRVDIKYSASFPRSIQVDSEALLLWS